MAASPGSQSLSATRVLSGAGSSLERFTPLIPKDYEDAIDAWIDEAQYEAGRAGYNQSRVDRLTKKVTPSPFPKPIRKESTR
ncbi:hypothetical protein [Rothia terrae]|uniref:Uncharacterized protein n=1 Tax=Rothia terrae TaxID=396015 RepID=A0A7H2BGE7_9MICC|nr:hypothetical protein [Rothia terrae]QNV38743.1 hypothetical protein IDM49_05750 [Rothia terrae]